MVRLLPSNAYLMGVLKKKGKEAQSPMNKGFRMVLVIVEKFFYLSRFKALKTDKMNLKNKE